MSTQLYRSRDVSAYNLLKALFKSGDYSDLTIKCKDRVFKVHRNIVCTRSPPLAAAVNGNFKEATTGVIDLEDDDPDVIYGMLNFLYSKSYGRSASEDLLNTNTAMHVKQYIIADKYDILELRNYAEDKFKLLVFLPLDLPSFVQSIRLLYTELPSEAHKTIYHLAFSAICRKIDSLNLRHDFKEVLADFPEISHKLVTHLLADRRRLNKAKKEIESEQQAKKRRRS